MESSADTVERYFAFLTASEHCLLGFQGPPYVNLGPFPQIQEAEFRSQIDKQIDRYIYTNRQIYKQKDGYRQIDIQKDRQIDI